MVLLDAVVCSCFTSLGGDRLLRSSSWLEKTGLDVNTFGSLIRPPTACEVLNSLTEIPDVCWVSESLSLVPDCVNWLPLVPVVPVTTPFSSSGSKSSPGGCVQDRKSTRLNSSH